MAGELCFYCCSLSRTCLNFYQDWDWSQNDNTHIEFSKNKYFISVANLFLMQTFLEDWYFMLDFIYSDIFTFKYIVLTSPKVVGYYDEKLKLKQITNLTFYK